MHQNTLSQNATGTTPSASCPVYKRLSRAYGPVMAVENVARHANLLQQFG